MASGTDCRTLASKGIGIEGIFDAYAAEDLQGLPAGAASFGVAFGLSGKEHRLGLLELAGVQECPGFQHDRVFRGEGGGGGRRLGGRSGAKGGGHRKDQADSQESEGFPTSASRAHVGANMQWGGAGSSQRAIKSQATVLRIGFCQA